MKKFLFFICSVQVFLCYVYGYRILMAFPTHGRSHHNLGVAIAKALVSAGNDVTLISSFFKNHNAPIGGKYINIFLEGFLDDFSDIMKFVADNKSAIDAAYQTPFENTELLNAMGYIIANLTLEHPKFKEFLKSKEVFDVVIVEQFYVDALKALACHFHAPLIVFSTEQPNAWINSVIRNPWPPSYIPDVSAGFSYPMSAWERFWNTVMILFRDGNFHNVYIPQQNTLMKKHFPHCPDLCSLAYNVSLIFLNAHESFSQAMPYLPNMIDIGGIHLQPVEDLPRELQEFMDNANTGVIYFSMGSIIPSSEMPSNIKQIFVNVFAKINQKVLWKYDGENITGLTDNVRLGKWFPQQGILAHPNMRVFITHGGIGSLIEAVNAGVPLLTVPVLGDQHSNGVYAEYLGYAVNVPFRDITEIKISRALSDIINNPKYQENAKYRSSLLHDRPMKPVDVAVYWTEFVIRSRGAPHLRVGGVDMPWYKYFLVDIFACLILGISTVLMCLYYFIRLVSENIKAKQD